MSSGDEFELNYIKIDSENEIELLSSTNYAKEISLLFETIINNEQYKIAKSITKDIEKNIHDNSELLKNNIEFSKKFIKIITSDKRKKLNASVKRILSIDFGKEFIFNYSNIFDVCSILTLLFTETKKYKISSIEDLKNIIKKINFPQYDFYRLYLDFSKKNNKRNSISSSSINTKISNDIKQENNLSMNYKNLETNIKNYFVLNNELSYLKDEESSKAITRNKFIYPEYNKNIHKNFDIKKIELPIELIMLLSKLRQVNCLIFQIQNIQKKYLELANFILSNIEWLFIKEIEEIKFDLCNEEIQKELDKAYDKITEDLYSKNNINKSLFYYNGVYSARSINCWMPECDFYFEEKETINRDCNYRNQLTEDSVVITEYTCNINNAFGNLMNIRYIPKINFSILNNFDTPGFGQFSDSRSSSFFLDDLNNYTINKRNSFDLINEAASIFELDLDEIETTQKKNKINENNIQLLNDIEIPSPLIEINDTYNNYFKMVLFYSYYLSKSLRKINSLSLFFQDSFSYEININYKIEDKSELTHFLIFLNNIEFLQEINISFNSLDDKSFEYMLRILHKNTLLSKIRISFFTPDLNYYDNSLFNLCVSKKIDLSQLFSEFSEYQKNGDNSKERKFNEYILEEKLLNPFIFNLCNLSNLLKHQLIKNIEELVLRFDIPLPLINNQKYRIVIIKFIFDILIMLTFQDNRTNTFKILAPNLEINSNKMPFIKSFFNEISLTEEENNNETNQNVEIKTGETIEEIDNKEINDKKIESALNNNKNKKVINKTDENKQQILSQLSKEKMKEFEKINKKKTFNKINDFDIDKQYIPKSSSEKAVIRKNSSEEYDNINSEIQLYYNNRLENLVIQLKICFLPEIFNICKINNLAGLKYINLGNLDEISFKGFVDDYKLNCSKLKSLVTLKINLGFSVLSYDNLEKYIFDFINTNSPKLREKLLLSNLIIDKEDKMEKLIDLVYLKANIEKLIVKINNDNIDLLSKLLPKFIIQYRTKYIKDIYTLMLILNHPKCKKINEKEIIENLCDFIIFSKNKTILCDEIS